MTTRSGKVIDTTPTWAPFRGWSVLLEFDERGIGIARPVGTERTFASLLGDLTVAFAELAGSEFARLPDESLHITLCDGVNTGMSDNTVAGWTNFTDPRVALDLVGDAVGELCAAAATSARWKATALQVRGHAVVLAIDPDVDFVVARIRRRQLLERLGSIVGRSLETRWRPHITIGYLLHDDHVEQIRRYCDMAGQTTFGSTGHPHPPVITDRAGIYQFSDMATFWKVRPAEAEA